ncbi:DUF1844 domain-containing protein [bacterium]|nr:MAG: DUF1844 domain-containing protein [bacterium]RKZ23291.1 MAG: DUF1844 domain-containing protein [bacterium]RKZ25765.1 MAG: DUF1844 domain-containing protein [bacterium]
MEKASFEGLIVRLASGALMAMGLVEDPVTGKKQKDLELARYTIETLEVLKEKTKGNLTREESIFLDSIIAELKIKYAKVKEGKDA